MLIKEIRKLIGGSDLICIQDNDYNDIYRGYMLYMPDDILYNILNKTCEQIYAEDNYIILVLE